MGYTLCEKTNISKRLCMSFIKFIANHVELFIRLNSEWSVQVNTFLASVKKIKLQLFSSLWDVWFC